MYESPAAFRRGIRLGGDCLMKRLLDTSWCALSILCTVCAIYGCSTPPSERQRTVTQMRRTTNGVILRLDNGTEYLIGFHRKPYNKTNLLLFYEGKRVWVSDKEKDGCIHIEPIKQGSMPTLTDEGYDLLIEAGFSDSDIEYSFKVPSERRNPNPEKPTYGGTISYGAPSVCGEKLS